MSHIGAKIRAERIARGVTLPNLAAQAGISKGLLSTIETNELSNPSIGTLAKIADALDTSVSEIVSDRDTALGNPSKGQPRWLKNVEVALRMSGTEPDSGILEAMHVLQSRKALRIDDIEYWTSLYKSIEAGYRR